MTERPEYTTLVQCNQKLRAAIQGQIASIGTGLREVGLVNPDLDSHVQDDSRSASERAARLVHFIATGVQLDPKSYWTFINVLGQQPHASKIGDILQTLHETYSSNIGEFDHT